MGYSRSVSSGRTIPFNVIKSNMGNRWSSSYHRFTAPVKGLYYFSLSIITPFSPLPHQAGASIMRGNVHLSFVSAWRSRNTNSHIPASGSVAVMLNAGEHVWARRKGGNLYSNGNLLTNFVGFLIQKVI